MPRGNEPQRPARIVSLDPAANGEPSVKKRGLAALIGTGAAALLVAQVAGFEGKRNDPYKDIVGVWTVCYGETRVAMKRYSDAECKTMLADGLADYAAPVLARNPELKGHDGPLAAAVSLAYNIGPAAYRKSSVARNFSAGRWKDACDAFLKWSYAGGKQVKGLLRRRQEERAMCLRGA
jgi:lysozyme